MRVPKLYGTRAHVPYIVLIVILILGNTVYKLFSPLLCFFVDGSTGDTFQ